MTALRKQEKIFSTPLFIGGVYIKRNMVMAPMAGITDLPFRSLAKEGGAGLVFTEMISANALVHKDERTSKMLRISKSEYPAGVQLFGAKPEVIAEAARISEGAGADIIDITLGCPVRKIVRSGAGVKLIENEAHLIRVMEKTVSAVKGPVTIKVRIGSNGGENTASRLAKKTREAGGRAITGHGRTAEAVHSGSPDLDAIRAVVETSKIPVIGNGGIVDELSAVNFVEKTGCAGIMIGRAAIGNFDIFKRIEYYINSGNILPHPSWEDRLRYLKKHALIASAYYGEKKGVILLRKIAAYYLKGLPNASAIRNKFNKAQNLAELTELLNKVWHAPYFEGKI